MDLLLLRYLTSKPTQESFGGSALKSIDMTNLLLLAWSIFATIWAIGTSWHCNTVNRADFLTKWFYAFWASIFPTAYLILRHGGVIHCKTGLT